MARSKSSKKLLQEAESLLIRYGGEFSPTVIDKAQGVYLHTREGKCILDFTSGQMCSVFGHNHPQIMQTLRQIGEKPLHLLSTMLTESLIDMGRNLLDLLPAGLDRVIFLNTGSESNEVAIRMAKLFTEGFEVIGFSGSWHGMTAGAQAHTYSKTRKGYGPTQAGSLMLPAPYAYRCPIGHCQGSCDQSCLKVGMQLVDQQSVGAYAALIAEPILSAAGVIELDEEYMKTLQALCEERGLLLILDEAQTGLGRTGRNFAFEKYEQAPDFLTLSKTLGGGLPLAAMITSQEIEEECYKKGFLYVTSHVSDPLGAMIGLSILEILEREKMSEMAREKGKYLKSQLIELQSRHECIGDVRGRGLLLGVEIVKDREGKEPDPELGHRISERCLKLGLSMNIVRIKGYAGVFRIAPPLTITLAQMDLGISILDQAILDCTRVKKSQPK